ncbi:hypothetical protein DOTSEDRAFT_107581, partial [Dothistroma septosporum NZE10]
LDSDGHGDTETSSESDTNSTHGSQEPCYETISYVWGDATKGDFIYIDGKVCDVSRSSEQASRRVQHAQQAVTVWTDAVCIDQNDGKEKSLQVASMADIHRHGKENLVFLGDANEHTESAL